MDQEVHKKLCRSIVRIFIDIASEGEETNLVLIPGIIIASNDKSCHILALDKYFVYSTKTKFSVNFPKNGAVLKYEIEKSSVTMGNGIATFDVLAERAGYDTNMIEAVQFGGPKEEGNLLLMLAASGILWMEWTGRFNGGDPFSANTDSLVAVLNTHVCLDLLRRRRSWKTVRGGLVGAMPWYTMDVLCFNKVDDTLGVQAGGAQILKQVVAAFFVVGWNVVVTSMVLIPIKVFLPLRMTDEELIAGDYTIHGDGEMAYSNI